jgi:hypothetical protein
MYILLKSCYTSTIDVIELLVHNLSLDVRIHEEKGEREFLSGFCITNFEEFRGKRKVR